MSDYFYTLIKDIIENNEKKEAIEIIANKLNELQISAEKEILNNLEKDKEIERLNNIINEIREFIEWHYEDNKNFYKNKGIGLNYPECDYILELLNKGDDKE